MKPTIRNKLLTGFTGLLLLLIVVASTAVYAVVSLRHSALETARVGDRLNSIALEIQIHNLEAQRRVQEYFQKVKAIGPEKAREEYLDEAEFEINEIENLAARATRIAPTDEKRRKFERINQAVAAYTEAMEKAAKDAGSDSVAARAEASASAYAEVASQLHDSAEDGEMEGRDSSQSSQSAIEKVSARAVPLVVTASVLGLILAIGASISLLRAILLPIQHLRDIAENVSMGNLDISVRRFSNDEIGDLSDSFSRMVTAVKFFRSEAEASESSAVAEVMEP